MHLTAQNSPFTTFCEGPEDIAKGYELFNLFHLRNHADKLPADRHAAILVVSSGVGYFQYFLANLGYDNVTGVDSDPTKVAAAINKGFCSTEGNCFELLAEKNCAFDLIFAEQEINHLTRTEFIKFLECCYRALLPGGKLIVTAANCANPIIAPEYLGNNIDHYTSFTENSLKQYFSLTQFTDLTVFPDDFYVLRHHPLNYPAKAVTMFLHLILKVVFRLYGKSNVIFTKRIGAVAVKPTAA
jgi:SAM-dependent methyltransferase